MRETARSVLGVASLALVVAILPQPAAATHLEAHMYVVTDWSLECGGSARPYWDDMVEFWYDEIDDHGWDHQDRSWDRDPFCDPDTGLANCRDWEYVDDADAAMLGMHGGDSGNHWRGSLRRDGGASVNDCRIDANESGGTDEMYLGDWDLEFLHLSSCNSMDDDNLSNTWRYFRDPFDSPGHGRRLHQADGFHGFMWIGGCCDDQYEDFAADAHTVSIRDAWIDNMYVTGINGYATQCPVAYAVGTTADDCLDRLRNERYNNVYSDPGSINYYCYTYYVGCDPDGEGPFGE